MSRRPRRNSRFVKRKKKNKTLQRQTAERMHRKTPAVGTDQLPDNPPTCEAGALRQVECSLTFTHCREQLLLQALDAGIIRQLEVVDASHHTREIIVRSVRMLAWLADDGERGRQ